MKRFTLLIKDRLKISRCFARQDVWTELSEVSRNFETVFDKFYIFNKNKYCCRYILVTLLLKLYNLTYVSSFDSYYYYK